MMGETTSDFLVRAIDLGVVVGLGAVALVDALVIQVTEPRYVAWKHWLAVTRAAVFGTTAAVVASHSASPMWCRQLSSAHVWRSFFALWFANERTSSVHSIRTPRREACTGRRSTPPFRLAPPPAI